MAQQWLACLACLARVEEREGGTVVGAMAWFFLIVTARNLVKSVREEMGVAGGVSAPCLALGRAHERRRERLLRPGAA